MSSFFYFWLFFREFWWRSLLWSRVSLYIFTLWLSLFFLWLLRRYMLLLRFSWRCCLNLLFLSYFLLGSLLWFDYSLTDWLLLIFFLLYFCIIFFFLLFDLFFRLLNLFSMFFLFNLQSRLFLFFCLAFLGSIILFFFSWSVR